MKSVYVSDLHDGDSVDELFLVVSKSTGATRAGAPFIKCNLSDKTGAIQAVKWDATPEEIESFSEADYIKVRGKVGSFNGQPQLRIDSFYKYIDEVDSSDFLPVTHYSTDEMLTEFRRLIDKVKNPQLRQLLACFFDDERTMHSFKEAPAAIRVHHAYLGGLLEHTLNVVKTCDLLSTIYTDVDRDILLTAASLHDIGKLQEYDWSSAFRFTDTGHFVGHVVGGAMMVKEAADSIEGFDPLLNLAMQHAILSHHGLKEYGSPKQPKSLEAMIVHFADELDADAAMYHNALADASNDNDSSLFTKKHFFLDRPLFKGMPQPDDASNKEFDSDLFSAERGIDPFADD